MNAPDKIWAETAIDVRASRPQRTWSPDAQGRPPGGQPYVHLDRYAEVLQALKTSLWLLDDASYPMTHDAHRRLIERGEELL